MECMVSAQPCACRINCSWAVRMHSTTIIMLQHTRNIIVSFELCYLLFARSHCINQCLFIRSYSIKFIVVSSFIQKIKVFRLFNIIKTILRRIFLERFPMEIEENAMIGAHSPNHISETQRVQLQQKRINTKISSFLFFSPKSKQLSSEHLFHH